MNSQALSLVERLSSFRGLTFKLPEFFTLSILERFIMQCPLVPTLEGPLLNSKVSLYNIV